MGSGRCVADAVVVKAQPTELASRLTGGRAYRVGVTTTARRCFSRIARNPSG